MSTPIKEQQISFETAKLAREKNFDWPCTEMYVMHNGEGTLRDSHYGRTRNSDLDCGAVAASCSQTILQKWLRETHKREVTVYACASGYLWDISKTNGTFVDYSDDRGPNSGGCWDNYEQCLEAGLFACLDRLEV